MHRILILTHEFPPFHGGIATVAHGLASGAAAIGHEARVLAPAYHGNTAEWDAAQPYEVSRFPGATCSVLSLDKLAKFTARCRREIRLRKPDIVHAVDPPAQMALTALSRMRLVRTYFFTVYGTELLRYHNDLSPRLWMFRAFRRVACTSAISRSVREILINTFKVREDTVFVSYPGVGPRWFETPSTDRAQVRARWEVSPDETVVLTVARRVPDKGHQRVIEGLSLLPASLRRRLVYVVVGGGPEDYARDLRAKAESGSVRLLMLGALGDDELVEACDAADLFIQLSQETPSRLEGLGLVYLEAATRGVPSIACDTGGVAEAVRHGDTGIVLPYYPTAEQVAEALISLAGEDGVRAEMGRRAREFAATFTWRRSAEEVYTRFAQALLIDR